MFVTGVTLNKIYVIYLSYLILHVLVNIPVIGGLHMRQRIGPSQVQIVAYRMNGVKPVSNNNHRKKTYKPKKHPINPIKCVSALSTLIYPSLQRLMTAIAHENISHNPHSPQQTPKSTPMRTGVYRVAGCKIWRMFSDCQCSTICGVYMLYWTLL